MNFFHARRRMAPIVSFMLGAAVSYACGGETRTAEGGTDSNTHFFFNDCERDEDCDGLSCRCGVCTRPCTEDAECSGLSSDAVCDAHTACPESAPTICVPECAGDRCSAGAMDAGTKTPSAPDAATTAPPTSPDEEPVDCSTVPVQTCGSSSDSPCMPIETMTYDDLGSCFQRADPLGCRDSDERCEQNNIARNDAGECRLFASCLAPGWTAVGPDTATECGTEISASADLCDFVEVECDGACSISSAVTYASEGGMSLSCELTIPLPPEGRAYDYDVNVSFQASGTIEVIGFVHDPSQCDHAPGGWYRRTEADGTATAVLCPATCDALGPETIVEVALGCPTRRIDDACLFARIRI